MNKLGILYVLLHELSDFNLNHFIPMVHNFHLHTVHVFFGISTTTTTTTTRVYHPPRVHTSTFYRIIPQISVYRSMFFGSIYNLIFLELISSSSCEVNNENLHDLGSYK